MKRRLSSKHSIEDEVELAIEWETMRKEIACCDWNAVNILVHSAGVHAMGRLEVAPVVELDVQYQRICVPVSFNTVAVAVIATAARTGGLH